MSTTTSPTSAPSTAAVIKQLLRAKLGRQWSVGDRLPPVKELARQLGTGQFNTNVAIRELASEGLLESRQRRGTTVLRTPQRLDANSAELDLSDRRITLVYEAMPEGFIQEMIEGFRTVMRAAGAEIRVSPYPAWDKQRPHHQLELSPLDDAIVLFNPTLGLSCMPDPDQLVSVITTAGHMPVERRTRYDMVSVDDRNGGQIAGRLVKELGCRKPGFVGRAVSADRYDMLSTLRLGGFEEGWQQSIDPQHQIMGMGYSLIAGSKAFRRYLRMTDQPDAIFCASDDLAIGFAVAATSHGLQPGQDFQLIGFDGQARGQQLGESALTTIKVPAAEMGRRAAQLLIERFADPDRPVNRLQMECDLLRGSTTRA